MDLRELKYLLKLPGLKVLWLHDNPCAQVFCYCIMCRLKDIAKLLSSICLILSNLIIIQSPPKTNSKAKMSHTIYSPINHNKIIELNHKYNHLRTVTTTSKDHQQVPHKDINNPQHNTTNKRTSRSHPINHPISTENISNAVIRK